MYLNARDLILSPTLGMTFPISRQQLDMATLAAMLLVRYTCLVGTTIQLALMKYKL